MVQKRVKKMQFLWKVETLMQLTGKHHTADDKTSKQIVPSGQSCWARRVYKAWRAAVSNL